jgi:hypothetical protein
MVIVDPHEGQNPKEEVEVRVLTQGGIRTGSNLKRGESLG